MAIEAAEIHKCWCAIATNVHGRQKGRLGGAITNLSLSPHYQHPQPGNDGVGRAAYVRQPLRQIDLATGSIEGTLNNETEIHFRPRALS